MPYFSYDLHLHSCLSPCGDNEMTPANIAGMAFVAGLQLVALTDHNSCGNCAAFAKAAAQYGITPIYGMELTTAEEVHVVCLFENEKAAHSWQQFVAERLLVVENNPEIFGHQYYMNEADCILGEEPHLLINATTVAFENVFAPVWELGGIAIPAHVDKNANSLFSNLGFVPPESTFRVAELRHLSAAELLLQKHPYLKGCRLLSGSDAHYLQDIGAAGQQIFLEENSAACLLSTLRNNEGFFYDTNV